MLYAFSKFIPNTLFLFVKQLKLCQPNPDDLGYVDSVSVEEIGGARVCDTYFPLTTASLTRIMMYL